jgi:hypothetical protein
MFETFKKGELAQLQVQLKAAEKGVVVSRPTTETRYDLVLDVAGKLVRAQVKYADGKTPCGTKGSIQLSLSRDTRNNGKKRPYTADEIDVLLVYVPKLKEILWLEAKDFQGVTSLVFRLEAPRNNQKKGVRLAQDFIWR